MADLGNILGSLKVVSSRSYGIVTPFLVMPMSAKQGGKRTQILPVSGATPGRIKASSIRKLVEVWSVRKPLGGLADTQQLFLSFTPGVLSGTVQTSGSPDVKYSVRLYYRPTGYLLDQVRTDEAGAFTFNKAVNKDEAGNYMIIAIDAANTYNAVVYDKLTPV